MPLASDLKLEFSVNSLLDEQLPQESRAVFESRIRDYLKTWLENHSSLSIACSHGDWIPAALKETTGLHLELGKSGWIILAYHPTTGWSIEQTELHAK